MLEFVRDLVFRLPISTATQETILEGMRWAVLAFFSALVTYLLDKVATLPNPEVWRFVLTLLLRGLDKYKYIENKETKSRREYNGGLIGF